ncbi:hypothetical protein ASF87_13025 [Microbacterium sp. Leaf161]|uniref:DUF6325 family protein n=1 Tax=Microbacterium sp. Leaf161 TaxID=1736281 RepID=UPI0007017CA0|nr:DUF6325 family protein [Microbacterium sp. Leaf161]KQR45184.1 hypothetical protein ASF87_13025 [Microbacterium sp. Leaf161]
MPDLEYGPVELILVGLASAAPEPRLRAALADVIESGTVKLVDLVLVSHDASGEVQITEIEDVSDEYGFGEIELEATGIAAHDDILALAEQIPAGTSAAVLVIEHTWARRLASALTDSGGLVLATERIPAPVVNDLLTHLRD